MNGTEIKRLHGAKLQILELLKAAGSDGMTTWSLIEATHHSAAARRVWELVQDDGYNVEKVNEGGGVYRWIYRGESQPSLFGRGA
jgi:hypothetical protein